MPMNAMTITPNVPISPKGTNPPAGKETTAADEMGQQAFLKLFTTQLQHQNPLDPVKNEAFVAQLAQFSQLEATTKTAESMAVVAAAMQSDRILAGASLLGKKVVSPTASAQLADGATIRGIVSVPNGASSVRLDVYGENGSRVFSQTLGRQGPGDVAVSWTGVNDKGERMPSGRYRIIATVDSFGQVSQVPISTPTEVKSVTYDNSLKELVLELIDGSTVPLSKVNRVDG